MAPTTTTFPLDDARKALYENGYLAMPNHQIGKALENLERKGFQHLSPLSPHGLEFCRDQIFGQANIISIVESTLGENSLGHLLRYQAFPGHIECFIKGGRKDGLGYVAVQFYPKESRVDYYRNSHLHDLPTVENDRGLHETTAAALNEAGCFAKPEKFPDGGVVLRDGRCFADNPTEYVVTAIFVKENLLGSAWPKFVIPLNMPNYLEIVRKIVKMETERTRVNFTISTPANPNG